MCFETVHNVGNVTNWIYNSFMFYLVLSEVHPIQYRMYITFKGTAVYPIAYPTLIASTASLGPENVKNYIK